MPDGFFAATAWQRQKQPLPLLAECGACGLWKDCKSPYMPVSGEGRRRVLIVAEAPGKTEDDRGVQLVGDSGFRLVSLLRRVGVDMRRDCWLTNAVICRPHEGARNRNPDDREILYCRPNLSKTLKELKPDVVIPLGKAAVKGLIPLAWGKENAVDRIGTWAGWRIPSVRLNTWVCPTYHPSFLMRSEGECADEEARADPGVVEMFMLRHLAAAFSGKGKPWPKPPDWDGRALVSYSPEVVEGYIERFIEAGEPVAFDYETTTLKPDGPHAEILCCSVSDGEVSVAYPWTARTAAATKRLVRSPLPKVAANIRFEERWTRAKLGCVVRNWAWDTVVGAHWRDCRRGITSLKFQAFVLLGVEDYSSHLDAYMGENTRDKNSNAPNRLKEVEQSILLKYCSLDSLFEVLVARKQREEWYDAGATNRGEA